MNIVQALQASNQVILVICRRTMAFRQPINENHQPKKLARPVDTSTETITRKASPLFQVRGVGPNGGKIIAAKGPMVAKWRLINVELLPKWSLLDGRVVLLWDATHAMLPHQGSGAGYAIEEAYILSLLLHDYSLSCREDLSK